MAKEESDEMPMLVAPGLRDLDSPQSIELSNISGPSSAPFRRGVNNGYFSGPLRPENRYFSGPLRGNTNSVENTSFSGPLRSDNRDVGPKLSSIPSISNVVRRRPLEQSHTGKHEHLLKSGPLGKCNDPFCTTCPLYFQPRHDVQYPSSEPDQKVHMVFLGGANNLFTKVTDWSLACIPGVMNPHTKLVQQWNKFFLISCLLATFVDPLFFFILSVNQEFQCIFVNSSFSIAITILRSFTDAAYFLHMLLQFRLAYNDPASQSGAGMLVDDPKKIFRHYLSGWFFLDLFVVLPLPQVMIWVVVPKLIGKTQAANFAKNLLRVIVLLQYIPRMIRFVPLLAGNSATGFIFETAWANFFINLSLFFLVAHVVGSCWYLFGLQRVNECLHDACVNATSTGCITEFLDCGEGGDIIINDTMTRINASLWNLWLNNSNASNCFASGSNLNVFTYGIYSPAVNLTFNSTIVTKYVYSLFWGFQQITTFAGNQVPSLFIWEVLFVMGIMAVGLFLLVLLIGNMQNFLLSLSSRGVEMQWRRHDVELWMARRQLPLKIKRKVRHAERFKWAANTGVNEEELLKSLPEDLEKDIRRILCLDLVKRVRLFTVMEDQVLDAICQRLRQRLYIEESQILRMNYPIDKMLFFIRGNLRSIGQDGSIVHLQGGDFCGDELLTWCLERFSVQPSGKRAGQRPVMGQHALSSRTVECLDSVEAFALEVADLEEVTKEFSRSLRNAKVQGAIRYASPYWRTRAAICIQVVWRHRKKQLEKLASMGRNQTSNFQRASSHTSAASCSFYRD